MGLFYNDRALEDEIMKGDEWLDCRLIITAPERSPDKILSILSVLDGEWKTTRETARWWMNYRTSPFRIAIIDSFWKMK